jgi:hypothetical protein
MKVNVWRRCQLICGFATGVLGFIIPFSTRTGLHVIELYKSSPGQLMSDLVLFMGPGLLVAIGSYVLVSRGKVAGLVMVMLGGLFLTGMTLIHMFGGVFYVFGVQAAVLILLQSFCAILTLILSLALWGTPQPRVL